jgi:hypothetical protein
LTEAHPLIKPRAAANCSPNAGTLTGRLKKSIANAMHYRLQREPCRPADLMCVLFVFVLGREQPLEGDIAQSGGQSLVIRRHDEQALQAAGPGLGLFDECSVEHLVF